MATTYHLADHVRDKSPSKPVESKILTILILGSMLHIPLAAGLLPGDLIVAAYVFSALILDGAMMVTYTRLRLLLFPLFLYLVGGLFALLDDGLAAHSVSAFTRDLAALAWFIGGFVVVSQGKLDRLRVARICGIAVLFQAVALLVTYAGYRSAGTFPNPNYAAHFVMVLLWAVFGITRNVRWIAVAAISFIIAAVTTGSFGLLVGAAVPIPLYAYATRRRLSTPAKLVRLGALGVMACLAVLFVFGTPLDLQVSDSLNSNRLDRSGTNRVDLWITALEAWEADPLGLGPEGIVAKKILGHGTTLGTEAHNDYVTTIVERGLIGFFGLILLIRSILATSRNDTATTLLMIALCSAAVFRDTIHYRHSLLILGVTVALDSSAGRRSQASSALAERRNGGGHDG